MKVTIVEGTPDEIRQVFPQLAAAAPLIAASAPAQHAPADTGAKTPVSTQFAYAVLTRLPLSNEQKKVLVTIYKASPKLISAPELMEAINYTRPQFSGLMGAFGRRVVNTDGYVDWSWFFDQEWNIEEGVNYYGLPTSVRQAMEKAKLV